MRHRKVSIVIPTLNAEHEISQLLSLLELQYLVSSEKV